MSDESIGLSEPKFNRPRWTLGSSVWLAVVVLFFAGTLAAIILRVYAFGENGLKHINATSPSKLID